MKIETVHDVWAVAAEVVEAARRDNKELPRAHEIANMFGKMHNVMRLKLEVLKLAKIAPTVKNIPEVMSNPR